MPAKTPEIDSRQAILPAIEGGTRGTPDLPGIRRLRCDRLHVNEFSRPGSVSKIDCSHNVYRPG